MNECECTGACNCKSCQCGAHANFFSALANETRLLAILALHEDDKSVNELAHETQTKQSTLSHALKHPQDAGLVEKHVQGRKRIYSLNHDVVEPLWTLIDPHVHEREDTLKKPCRCTHQ